MSTARTTMATELALLLLLATLWGASYTFIKLGVQTIPPVTFIAARTLIAGLLLLAVMRARGLHLPADAATWRRFLFQACLNSAVPFTLIAWAETSVEAGLATDVSSRFSAVAKRPRAGNWKICADTRSEFAVIVRLLRLGRVSPRVGSI